MKEIKIDLLGIAIIPLGIAVTTNNCINSFATVASSSFVQFFVFSSNSLYSGVCPHCSFARLEYSSIFLVSNTLKSIYFTPIPFIPRAKLIRFSRCSFFIVSKSICCSNALFLSKLGASIIFLISLSGNSNSLNSKICCSLSKDVSSYNL